ncbi:MAG: aspartate/glutamate racemase family protein [Bradyrhizobium sp.]|uniref:maleate cis-trans isomerase family protein n=1 Tax=Bradyrhizobium sp. TaxID=376 RepID=UPI001D60110B|nr:arylmalonate decarboxylase [Bradyrhizobium sp.]MBV9566469.1 aspartate/glutamate racemase family protein [Bradyrhizobium sp.]
MAEIDYGSRLRAGMLIPSGNSVAEPEIRAMLPRDVSMLVTRLALKGSSRPELMQMLEQLEIASRLLADAEVDVIVFHCTAVSTFAPELAGDICRRIRSASGIACFTTADAILAGLAHLKAKRVSLLTPYIDDVHAREIGFLEANGFQVERSANLGIDTNAEMARLTPAAILAWASDRISSRADACLVSCTAIKSAPVIAELERVSGVPVLTSNQSMVWHLLRSNGVGAGVEAYGRLLSSDR